jgi:hypothetical protein
MLLLSKNNVNVCGREEKYFFLYKNWLLIIINIRALT